MQTFAKAGRLLSLSVMLILWGCGMQTTSSNDGAIHINPYEAKEFVNLSEIADSIKCIKLQTRAEDMIGYALLTIVREKYIYVADVAQASVFVFDKEGQFVSKLNKRGRGPGEYSVMGPIYVDGNEEYLELYDISTERVLRYANISFEFLEEKAFPYIIFNSWRKGDGLYYCATDQIDNRVANGKKTNAGLLIVDGNHNVKTLFDKEIETNRSYYSVGSESFTENDKNEIFLSLMFDNSFYQLKAGEARAVLTVDFGKYGMDNSMGLKSTKEQMDYFQTTTNVASLPRLNANNANILSFSYLFKQDTEKRWYKEDDSRLYLEIKDRNKAYHVHYIKNDLSGFPNRIYLNNYFEPAHEALYQDYLVEIIDPSKYFENDTDKIFVDGIGEITSEDNLIIVFMKLKKSSNNNR